MFSGQKIIWYILYNREILLLRGVRALANSGCAQAHWKEAILLCGRKTTEPERGREEVPKLLPQAEEPQDAPEDLHPKVSMCIHHFATTPAN